MDITFAVGQTDPTMTVSLSTSAATAEYRSD